MESVERVKLNGTNCYWNDFSVNNTDCMECYFYVKCWKIHAKSKFWRNRNKK